jgi:hypothetical protein
VVENHIQNHAQSLRMRGGDKFDQILSRSESRIDLQKILNRVTVESIAMYSLLENRSHPKGGYSQPIQVFQLRAYALDCSALVSGAALIPTNGRTEMLRTRGSRVGTVHGGRLSSRPSPKRSGRRK